MITKNYLEPWIKKQLDEITKESNEPFNPNYESVLNYIAEHYSADETDRLMHIAFLYGKIVGDNVASDRIKWNVWPYIITRSPISKCIMVIYLKIIMI